MQKTFINPFTFVPRSRTPETSKGRSDVASAEQEMFLEETTDDISLKAMRHDEYFENLHTGRIVCRLTTKSPCVFGGQHSEQQLWNGDDCPTIVHNFQLNGEVAIPGTSLRGMISSIAESASDSAMRVLTNRLLTIRSTMQQSRSAIGMVYVQENKKWVLPLTFPNLKPKKRDGRNVLNNGNLIGLPLNGSTKQWEQIDNEMYIKSGEKAFIGFPIYTPISPTVGGIACDSFHSGNNQVVAIRGIDPVFLWIEDGEFHIQEESIQKKDYSGRFTQLVRPAKLAEHSTLEEFNPSDDDLVPGILRVLPEGTQNKRYNLFIPVPRTWVDDSGLFSPPPIALLESHKAIRQFETILQEDNGTVHNNQSDPVCQSLKGQPKNLRNLNHGDLVHFNLADHEGQNDLPAVDSVSISSVWREGPTYLWEDSDADNRISRLDDIVPRELRPFDKTRETISLAEKLFGWVTQDSRDEEPSSSEDDKLKAYRSRIRISNAVLGKGQQNVLLKNEPGPADWQRLCRERSVPTEFRDHFPLQILAGPKPPCAEFYFQGNGRVESFRNNFFKNFSADSHRIRGAKFYWNHKRATNSNQHYWTTKQLFDSGDKKANLKQKAVVQPVRKDVHFHFHVDFENLTDHELDLLCFALRPNAKFFHKLGFAKPLGLGSVKLDVVRFECRDQKNDYGSCTDLLADPTSSVGPSTSQTATAEALPERYRTVGEQAGNPDQVVLEKSCNWCNDLESIANWFEKLGTPADAKMGVVYPQAKSNFSEHELFKWFTTNRDGRSEDRTSRDGGEQSLPNISDDPEMRSNLKR